MRVQIWLDKLNQSILIEAESTYQKGDMFCVKYKGRDKVKKYPINHIFCVDEENFVHSHEEDK